LLLYKEFCGAGNQHVFQEIEGVVCGEHRGIVLFLAGADQDLLKEGAKTIVGLGELRAVQGEGDERGNLRNAVDLL